MQRRPAASFGHRFEPFSFGGGPHTQGSVWLKNTSLFQRFSMKGPLKTSWPGLGLMEKIHKSKCCSGLTRRHTESYVQYSVVQQLMGEDPQHLTVTNQFWLWVYLTTVISSYPPFFFNIIHSKHSKFRLCSNVHVLIVKSMVIEDEMKWTLALDSV